MDKNQLREAFKMANINAPIIIDWFDTRGNTTSEIVSITIGVGYGGCYTLLLKNGMSVSTKQSNEITSVFINNSLYNEPQRKKSLSSKVVINEEVKEKLATWILGLKINSKIKLTSTKRTLNGEFTVLKTKVLYAPFKQEIAYLCGEAGGVTLFSRRDSGLITDFITL